MLRPSSGQAPAHYVRKGGDRIPNLPLPLLSRRGEARWGAESKKPPPSPTTYARAAQAIVDTFRKFIEDNKDELTALQIIYEQPYVRRQFVYGQVRQLADAIEKPSYGLTNDLLWQAYEQLETSKVRRAGPQKVLTNIISLVRFAIGKSELLEPFPDTVNGNFEQWLLQQEGLGRHFTLEQISWLVMIKDHIATSASISTDDLEYAPFSQKGGLVKAYDLFREELDRVLEELNEVLVV